MTGLQVLRALYLNPPKEMFKGKVVTFQYNGKTRIVRVEKERVLDYIQGENILVDGEKPKNKYSTYKLADVQSAEITILE